MMGLPDCRKILRICSVVTGVWQTDRQMDGWTDRHLATTQPTR